ncbi:MAG: glycosyltransferase family 4 protein [Clostridia bacterium]|nr:glycosyltransferase family 4 protein [Clostridia bacterium]
MLGHKVIPSRRGGIENVLTTMCPILNELGVEVTCYNRSSDKVENEYIGTVKDKKYRGVRIKSAPTLDVKGIAAMMASFTGAIRAAFGRYDVVHFHAEGPCAAMWIPKLFGKKCVATVHGLDWQREKWGKGFASKYIKFGEKCLVKYADEVIVLSGSAQEYFKDTYNRETVLIPNGIARPTNREANIITEKFGLLKDEYICIISRLTAEKGIHYLIDAYNGLKTDKKLVIAGDTSDTDDYVALLREKAQENPNIIFTGFVSGDTLDELYSNAYMICLPSDLEGMSLSLLESLAYGNAVLCSDIPENTWVAEEWARYFKRGDVEDLRQNLQELCDNESAVLKLRNGVADFILEKYNWRDVAQTTKSLYESIK